MLLAHSNQPAVKKVSRRLGNLYSFTEDMKKLGLVPSSRILSYRLVPKDECASPMQEFQLERLIEYTKSIMPSSRSKFEITMYHDSVEIARKAL